MKEALFCLILLPTRVRFLVLTPPQSPLQGENFDQFVNWQSSWQGIWHICVKGGNGPEYLRHSLMSACPPSCLRQVIAGSKKRWSLFHFFFFFMNVSIQLSLQHSIRKSHWKPRISIQQLNICWQFYLELNTFLISHLRFCLK